MFLPRKMRSSTPHSPATLKKNFRGQPLPLLYHLTKTKNVQKSCMFRSFQSDVTIRQLYKEKKERLGLDCQRRVSCRHDDNRLETGRQKSVVLVNSIRCQKQRSHVYTKLFLSPTQRGKASLDEMSIAAPEEDSSSPLLCL